MPSGTSPPSTTICSRSGSSAPVRAEHRDVVGVEEVGDGEQQPRPRLAEHVRGLVALEARVDRHERRRRHRGSRARRRSTGGCSVPRSTPGRRARARRPSRRGSSVTMISSSRREVEAHRAVVVDERLAVADARAPRVAPARGSSGRRRPTRACGESTGPLTQRPATQARRSRTGGEPRSRRGYPATQRADQ